MARPEAPPIVSAEFRAAARSVAELPGPVLVEVAFAGRSNVGKSTLLNAVMQRKGLARTSSTPGCTRALTFFDVRTRDGAALTFVDLPGYGYAKRSKDERESWADLAERYLLERSSLALVVVLVDARRGLEPDDQDLFEMIETSRRRDRRTPKTLLVATKLDRLARSEQKPTLARLARHGRTAVGVARGEPAGIAELWRQIRAAILDGPS